MIRRVALLGLVALPLAARAAAPPTPTSGNVTFSDPPVTRVATTSSGDTWYVGGSACTSNAAVQLKWLAQLAGSSTYPITNAQYDILTSNTTGCPATTTGVTTNAVATALSGGALLQVEQYLNATVDGGTQGLVTGAGASCTATTDQAIYVCVKLYAGADRATVLGNAAATLTLQVAAAQAPSGVVVTPSDSALKVSWTASATPPAVKSYQAIARPPGCASTDTACAIYSGWVTGTSTTINNLTNNVTYQVTVQAQSLGGNVSAESTPSMPGTPIPVLDFFDWYKQQNGREVGGCSTGGGTGILTALGALGLLARARRRS